MNTDLLKWLYRLQDLKLTAPHGQGGECVDLAVLWCAHLGLPRVWADAREWFTHYEPTRWRGTVNGRDNYPPSGALVVWGESLGAGTGPQGHIAVAVAATPLWLLSFDQNYPSGSHAHLQLHTYVGVLGWLTPVPPAATVRHI